MIPKMPYRLFFLLLVYFTLIYNTLLFAREEIIIYVQNATILNKPLIPCEPLATFLNSKSTKFTFSCGYVTPEQILRESLIKGKLLILNPPLFVALKEKVSQNPKWGIFPLYNIYDVNFSVQGLQGAVIFTSQSSKIRSIKDLKNQSLGLVSENSGCYLLSYQQLKEYGLSEKDIHFHMVGSWEKIIQDVLSGKLKAGSVRTGVLEYLAKMGKIKLQDLKILNPKKHPNFPFMVSTELIPDWYFLYTRNISADLLAEVQEILSPLIKENKNIPNSNLKLILPYDPFKVQTLQRELLLGPYKHLRERKSEEERRSLYLLMGISLLALSIATYIYYSYRKTLALKREIEESHKLLQEMLEEKSSSLKKTSEKLREEMKKLARIIESVDSGIAIIDSQNKIQRINQAFQNILEKPLFHIIGQKVEEIFINLADPLFKQEISQLALPSAKIALNISAGKDKKFIEIQKNPLLKEGLSLLILKDLTSQKKWEREVLRYTQLETLRVIASGLAHDLNNLLGAILNHAEIMLCKNPQQLPHEIRDKIENIKKICLRAKSLTQELLIYGKSLILSKEAYSLSTFLKEVSDFSLAGSGVEVSYSFDPRVNKLVGDKNLLSIALHNILINARQAMQERGSIKITTDLKPPYIEISIIDSGPGIPPEIKEQLFTPFVTTKPGGSGLGLFSAKRIIEAHMGQIHIDSTPGKGTKVSILLPYHPEAEALPEEPSPPVIEKKGHKRKVLLMDDEPDIRESLKELLESFDYEVEACEDGESAIELYKTKGPFEAVILDLTVPGKFDGIQTFLQLRKINPEVKAILATGYAYKKETVDAKAIGFKEVLIKPYTIETLLTVLEEITS